jgi:malate synthase A
VTPAELLSSPARAFVDDLVRTFRPERDRLLRARAERQARFDAGERPDFQEETRWIRESDWRVRPCPPDLADRRVEITGPTDRKMVINALNSGASCFMADFEDSLAPTWANVVDGQANLHDAVRGDIALVSGGRSYRLGERPAVLMVRPRGWHLDEVHWRVDGAPAPGALVDFGLFVFHNARAQLDRGTGPYFYFPKMQSHREAALWDAVIRRAQDALGLPVGTVRCTCLIETLPGAFEMEEILFALKDHAVGLNCGRWDYIFSYIKTQRAHPGALLPDRAAVTMRAPFMAAYTRRLVEVCHRRGAHAMGGMAAHVPVKGDPEANERALAAVRADKLREVQGGHDGTWVAHPALVPVAREVFDAHMPAANQLGHLPEGPTPGRDALLAPAEGPRTAAGLRHAVSIALRYLDAWLGGQGCVAIDNLMEDAATAEISRVLLWHWARHGALLDVGGPVTAARVRETIDGVADQLGLSGRPAVGLFREMATAPVLADFLTLPAYAALVAAEDPSTLPPTVES